MNASRVGGSKTSTEEIRKTALPNGEPQLMSYTNTTYRYTDPFTGEAQTITGPEGKAYLLVERGEKVRVGDPLNFYDDHASAREAVMARLNEKARTLEDYEEYYVTHATVREI